MLHLFPLLPIVLGTFTAGSVRYAYLAISRVKDSLERLECQCLARQSACIDRLQVMRERAENRPDKNLPSLCHEKEPDLTEADCKCAFLLGTSVERAKNYWFQADESWLYPRKYIHLHAMQSSECRQLFEAA